MTEFERDGATVKIFNFDDQTTLNGDACVTVYRRISLSNHSSNSLSLVPVSSAGLIPLTDNQLIVPVGQTIIHDYVTAAGRSGNNYAWSSNANLVRAGSWD